MRADMSTPKELAHQNIDALLQQCGWAIQDHKNLGPSADKLRDFSLRKATEITETTIRANLKRFGYG
jgi:hypothetical protein